MLRQVLIVGINVRTVSLLLWTLRKPMIRSSILLSRLP